MAHIWVVEMEARVDYACSDRWVPCTSELSRSDGRRLKWAYQENNPGDKFRLKKYIRA